MYEDKLIKLIKTSTFAPTKEKYIPNLAPSWNSWLGPPLQDKCCTHTFTYKKQIKIFLFFEIVT